MPILFSSPAEAAAAFGQGAMASAIVTLAIAAVAAFAARSAQPVVSIKAIFVAGMVMCSGLFGYAYWSAYGRFLAAEVGNDGIALQYGGWQRRSIGLQHDMIETILVGQRSKTDTQCHIAIQLKSGETYRSASMDKKIEACKDIRRQMVAVLEAPAKP